MNPEEKISTIKSPETVVSGSFRKHMEQIGKAIDSFESSGVRVLAPTTKEMINPDEEFVILTTDDPEKPPHKLEMDFMREIRKADFLYVVDVDGYVGQSAATEMAYARLKNLPIIVAEDIKSLSGEIPGETQEIIKSIVSAVLPISNISREKIDELRQRITGLQFKSLSEKDRQILNSFLKVLLRDLKSLNK